MAIAIFILQLSPAFADDVITNAMSPVVSYQYYDSFGEDTNATVISPIASYQFYDVLGEDTNSAIVSPIVSYQYFDSLDASSVNYLNSPVVSYYYQFLNAPLLTIISTSRTPTTAEIAPLLDALPTTSQLLAFNGNIFTTNLASIDPNQPTIVLTHGWIPTTNRTPVFTPNGVADWPTTMAEQLRSNGVFTGNIVAWDWPFVARSSVDAPGIPEQQTGDQGQILGEKLLLTLGANYSKRIQFIGHSLGTLVNGRAANYLHGDRWAQESVSPYPWQATNTLMTLFDDAETARGFTSFGADVYALLIKNINPFTQPKPYNHPLPKQFAWAENYVAAVGSLQTNAANVILTNDFPANAPDIESWFGDFAAFHDYPMSWYNTTIQTDNSVMGYVWPFLWSLGDTGFANAPSNVGSVYIQAGSEYNLKATSWNYGTNLLAARYQAYRNALAYAQEGEAPNSAAVNGNGNGEYVVDALPAFESAIHGIIFWLLTTPANASPSLQINVRPLGLTANDANSSSANIPAYAWMPLVVPANAVSLSFDYIIQGDWRSDSLAAAFNGTNVLSLPGSQIETNILFSSSSIDVSTYAGQTNEFFIGIVGGTSTNAQLTLQNLAFSVSSSPMLQAQVSGGGAVLSWPLSAVNYVLETSTKLTDMNSWTTITNVPAIVSFQNTITNGISEPNCFYRLIKQ